MDMKSQMLHVFHVYVIYFKLWKIKLLCWIFNLHKSSHWISLFLPIVIVKMFTMTFFISKLQLQKSPTYIFLYNILGFVRLRWLSFPSIRPVIRPVIHPSKFLIPAEEDDGRGGGRKTHVVLQFAKSYKLIFKN